MKFLLLLTLIILAACSQNTDSTSRPNSSGFTNAQYLIIEENPEVVYASQHIRMASIDGDSLSYTIGLMNTYEKDKAGALRGGTHPESEFRIQSAVYKITKKGDKVKLKLLGSSCSNPNTDPFVDIIPQEEITLSQLEEMLKIETSSGTEVLYKDTTGTVNQLWGSNVSRILCGAENE